MLRSSAPFIGLTISGFMLLTQGPRLKTQNRVFLQNHGETTGFSRRPTTIFGVLFKQKAHSNTTTTFNLAKPIMPPLAMPLTIHMGNYGLDWLGRCWEIAVHMNLRPFGDLSGSAPKIKYKFKLFEPTTYPLTPGASAFIPPDMTNRFCFWTTQTDKWLLRNMCKSGVIIVTHENSSSHLPHNIPVLNPIGRHFQLLPCAMSQHTYKLHV